MADETPDNDFLELATELTIAWLSNPNTRTSVEEVPAFLQSMHGAIARLATANTLGDEVAPTVEYTPAVSVRRSLASRDHIISLIDGKPYKTLKRHLANHGLTPKQYRERYGLKDDYPTVAVNYAEQRRDIAKKIGLGNKSKGTTAPREAMPVPATAESEVAHKPSDAQAAHAAKQTPAAAKPRTLKIRTPSA